MGLGASQPLQRHLGTVIAPRVVTRSCGYLAGGLLIALLIGGRIKRRVLPGDAVT